MDCQFCKILDQKGERILQQTNHCIVILGNPRLMPGHMLVIPKRHVERLSELSKEERDDLFSTMIELQEKILKMVSPGCDICQHFRPFIPDNVLKVSHLHIHLRPRALHDELYEKVQIHETEVFQELDKKELEKFKKIFAH
jgi:diadenosine tetraphosphate (Ap4A) HIT family hydrolase